MDSAGNIFNTDLESTNRIHCWNASNNMIGENTILGAGVYKWSGNYPKYYGHRFDNLSIHYWTEIHAHNDFLELFAENGPIAPLLYVILLIIILKTLYVKSKSNRDYFFILLSIAATGLFSFINFPFYKFSSHFLLAVGVGIALYGNTSNKLRTNRISLRILKMIFILLAAVGLITAIMKITSEIHLIKGIHYLKDENYVQVNMELDKILGVLYPFDASRQPVEYYRGIANYSIGKYSEEKALDNNLKAQKLSPFNPLIMGNLAASYQALGNLNKAIEVYENTRRIFPNYAEPQINLLYLYLSTDQTEEQLELYKILIKKYPSHPRLLKYKELLSL